MGLTVFSQLSYDQRPASRRHLVDRPTPRHVLGTLFFPPRSPLALLVPVFIEPALSEDLSHQISGGAFLTGGTAMYDGSSIVSRSVANKQPVIFVSANYRINVRSFSSSSSLTTT